MYEMCVVGLGYVGLPTACAFARAGLNTVGVDTRSDVVELVKQGKCHLSEAGLAEVVRGAVASGRLHATENLHEAVSNSAAVIVAVQTPFEGGRAVLDHLRVACSQVATAIRPGTVTIIESTVPPGTCERLVLPLFAAKGKVDGRDFYFAYCPERIAPGNSLQEFEDNDRLIGASNPGSLAKAEALMKRAVKGKLIHADILHAETAKLVENTARDVYIAFANDLAKLGRRIGVDSREVIRLANTHPRVKILNPGPGVGGPCLTKDPYLLLEGLQAEDSDVGVTVRTARRVNENMFKEVIRMLDDNGAPAKGSRVAVLGTAYKPEVGDPRGSPSEQVVAELLRRGYDVWTYDPFCVESFGAKMASSVEEAASGAACLFILVAHSAFKSLDFESVTAGMAKDPLMVDAVGVMEPGARKSFRLVRLGDGTGAGDRGRR